MADNPPGSGIPIIGDVIQLLGEILSNAGNVADLARQVDTAETNSWQNALNFAGWAWDGLNDVWNVLKSIGLAVALALYHVFIDYILPIIKKIIEAIKWIKGKLDKILKPLQKILKRIRDFYVNHILKWELLAIQILSVIRVWLELLRLLHVKWAAKLDADLAKIQGYITDTITPVVSTLNEISTILGLAINPLGFISKSFMLGSLTNSLADVKKAAGYGSARLVFPDEKAQEKATSDAMHGTQPLSRPGPGGTIEYDPALQMLNDQMTGQVQAYGYTP
jgi:hypothetical protein